MLNTIHSNHKFSIAGTRLLLRKPTLIENHKKPGIRVYGLVRGFFGWIAGNTIRLKAVDIHGKSKSWFINKRSLAQWISREKKLYAITSLSKETIDDLVGAIKKSRPTNQIKTPPPVQSDLKSPEPSTSKAEPKPSTDPAKPIPNKVHDFSSGTRKLDLKIRELGNDRKWSAARDKLVAWHTLAIQVETDPIFPPSEPNPFFLPAFEKLEELEAYAANLYPWCEKHQNALRSVKSLSLSSKGLTTMPNIFSFLPYLETVDLSKNRLTHLPKSFSFLFNLKQLDLSGNCFKELPFANPGFRQLKTLNLAGNQLVELSASIRDLYQLEDLNISGNQLYTLPQKIMSLQQVKNFETCRNPFASSPHSIPLPAGYCQLIQEGRHSIRRIDSL